VESRVDIDIRAWEKKGRGFLQDMKGGSVSMGQCCTHGKQENMYQFQDDGGAKHVWSRVLKQSWKKKRHFADYRRREWE